LTMSAAMPTESKALRLARYLKEFVGLRTTTVRDVDKYEAVLWFGDMPNEPECLSPAWNDGAESSETWLEVRKQQFARPPTPPDVVLPWIDQQALRQATEEIPKLLPSRREPDLDAEITEGEEPPLVERLLAEHPEVIGAYEHYRPAWEAWSQEYRRRSRIQNVYAELFRLHTQIQKQSEILELVLGLGFLSWPGKSTIRRHVFTARINLQFDTSSGIIRVVGPTDGAQVTIEDDMLDIRPERGHYESVREQ